MNQELDIYSKYDYPRLLLSKEKSVIEKYTVGLYYDINNALRNGTSLYKSDIASIDNALNKFILPSKITVYRYINGSELVTNKIMKQLENGFYLDEAFTSTTVRKKKKNIDYKIYMSIKINSVNVGAFIKYISKFPAEDEFLVCRNTKLYTKSIEKKKNKLGDLYYDVKLNI